MLEGHRLVDAHVHAARLPTLEQAWSTRRMVFGADRPGVPGTAADARAVAELLPDDETVGLVPGGNAARVHGV